MDHPAFVSMLFVLAVARLGQNHQGGTTGPVVVVKGVIGGRVLLPCDVKPPSPSDAAILVLFYMENKKTPIYSLDSRGSSLYSAYHWSDPDLEERVDLQVDYGNQGLLLQKIRREDDGLYRCRVDFKASPTRNTRVRLEVIEPPRHLLITSKWKDERVVSKVAGPFPEKAEVILSCQVMGGKPPPKVSWWHEGALQDDVIETRTNQMTRNSLRLSPLTRKDLMKNLTCQAVNSNLTAPLSSTVSLDLAFPPTRVRIRSPGEVSSISTRGQRVIVVSEGEKNPLKCEVEGSRPQPVITWDIDGRNVNDKYQTITNPHSVEASMPGNSQVTSTLILIPRASDKDSLITCRAVNPQLEDEMLYDTARLNVLYKPRVTLTEGKKIDLQDVKEGNDIYFECEVDANPSADRIIWSRNGAVLNHNLSQGVLLSSSGTSLILQGVTRVFSGKYSCSAVNAKGSSTSNTLVMNVKYPPVCGDKNSTTIGGGLHEMVKASCHAQSHPPPTKFRWAFNSTRGLQDITNSPSVRYNDSHRVLQYRIRSTDDFGAFLCWASNLLGDMKDPCVINVIPAAKPEPVSGCKIFHNSSIPGGHLSVQCDSGWNGGLNQSFTLEVRKATHLQSKVLSALEHSDVPQFRVSNLQAGIEYLFTVVASNSRGRSDPVPLLYTVPGEVIAGLTHARTDPQKALKKMMPLIAVVLGVVATIVLSVLVVVCIVKAKVRRRDALHKMEFFSECTQPQEEGAVHQTNVDTLVAKDKDTISGCDPITRYDDCASYKGENPELKAAVQYQTTLRMQPNNIYYQPETDALLHTSNQFYKEGSLAGREDLLPLNDPHLLAFALTQDDRSNSLGRSSTLSSGSSASRPTFRSSQSTVVFNPKWTPESSKASEEKDHKRRNSLDTKHNASVL